MNNLHLAEGVFRDRRQAELAISAARRKGLGVPTEDLFEDSAGVHVALRTMSAPEDARQLLLDYGAYSVTISLTGQSE
jgi:hypothetical protein